MRRIDNLLNRTKEVLHPPLAVFERMAQENEYMGHTKDELIDVLSDAVNVEHMRKIVFAMVWGGFDG